MADVPIVCSLTPDALEARKQGPLCALLHRSAGPGLLMAGLRPRFDTSSETLTRIVRAVDADCCRFLRFTISVEPDDGAVILEMKGPQGTGEFLAALLES